MKCYDCKFKYVEAMDADIYCNNKNCKHYGKKTVDDSGCHIENCDDMEVEDNAE